MTYVDDLDETTTVRVSVRVRWVRPSDDSPRSRHRVLAFALTELGAWRGIRRAGAYGWPGETVVDWFPTHMDAEDADDMVRVGSEAMAQVPREYQSARGGMFAVDVWNGYRLTTFAPRMHW